MILGIKVGPQKQSFTDLLETNPPFAEVWFNIALSHQYIDLFTELKHRKMAVGLHFWGVLEDSTWANLSYPDTRTINESIVLIKQTIDIAAKNNFQYVNIHPGTQALVKLFFDREEFILDSEPVELARANSVLLENVKTLSSYADKRGVLLIVETVPQRVATGLLTHGQQARNTPKNIFELPIESIQMLHDAGLFIANDFCHTAANCISEDASLISQFLESTTNQLSKQTKLLHLGFIVPPYNGTDYHDTFENPLFETSVAIPNRLQMKKLLTIFKNRPDVYVLAEPQKDHVKNYFIAKQFMEEISL